MLMDSIFGKSVSAILPIFVFSWSGLFSTSVCASSVDLLTANNFGNGIGKTDEIVLFEDKEFPFASMNMIEMPAIDNLGIEAGKPDHVPPVNPPIDTPALYNGLVNAPVMMPANVPSHTFPGSGFGQVVVPVPAAVWLFISGLLGMISVSWRRKP